MRAILLFVAVLGLIGCARPYGPAEQILNQELVTPNNNKEQTKITITRINNLLAVAVGECVNF